MRCIAEYDLFSEASPIEGAKTIVVTHPEGRYKASFRQSSNPAPEYRCALRMWVEFDCDDLEESQSISDDLASEVLNALALSTGCSFEVTALRRIIEWTPGLAMRQAVLFAHDNATDAPFPVLGEPFTTTAGHFLIGESDPILKRAMRWFRQALMQESNEDRFQCLWLCVEVLVPRFKETARVPDSCAVCRAPLYCEACGVHPTHKPYPKQTIEKMITDVTGGDNTVFKRLNDIRNGLAHGDPLSSIVPKPEGREEVLEHMGEVAWRLLIHCLGKHMGTKQFEIGRATMFSNMTMRGAAKVASVFEADAEGIPRESGITFKVVRGPGEAPEPLRAQVRVAPDEGER